MAVFSPSTAHADDTIKHPGDHLTYKVEIEPHALFGVDNAFATGGLGLGARFSIPIVQNGFIPKINNSVAISFGLDWLHYNDCRYGLNDCSASYLYFPVAMQWNFWVAQRWSVFGEPGAVIYDGFLGDCNPGVRNCNRPNTFGAEPALWIGGRFHVSETVSLTMRIGFPSFSFGVSFFP